MRIEMLISAMHQKDLSLPKKMNVSTDCLIINQCDEEGLMEENISGKRVRMMSFNERGLSKSRNKAINNSNSDVCIIADDDLRYYDNYEQIICEAYKKYPDADIISFDFAAKNVTNRIFSNLKEGKIGFLRSMKLLSFQITFKRSSILSKGINFNELFGTGAQYTCGEENIFLIKCLLKRLKIVHVKQEILIADFKESSWYKGFNKDLFKTKGAMFYEMSSILAYPLCMQFVMRKYFTYKNQMSFSQALKFILEGLMEYKKLKNELGLK